MKLLVRPLSLAIASIFAVAGLIAQSQVAVQDGGVRQTLESIFIPPMANAPFTCTLQTEWVQAMADGGTLTLVNRRKIARQSNGRFYQERWVLVPKNGQVPSQMSHIQIADPISHTLLTCTMGTNVCRLENYGGEVTATYKPSAPVSGPLPNGAGNVTTEALGENVFEGVSSMGTRVMRTINPLAMGNDKTLTITREFWFSPALGINLVSKISDPRFGSQNFTVTELTQGEPDPQLFETPKGYTVKDERPAPEAQ